MCHSGAFVLQMTKTQSGLVETTGNVLAAETGDSGGGQASGVI